jgi:hypothetical protein
MFLDSKPSSPNKAVQMETQYVPSYQSVDSKGETYARIAPTSFPRDAKGDSALVHRVTAYNKSALWDSVKGWFEGGANANSAIDAKGASVHTFNSKGGSTWKIYTPNTPKEKKTTLAWNSFANPVAINEHTYGYRWNQKMVTKTESKNGSPLVTLPEYYHHSHPEYHAHRQLLRDVMLKAGFQRNPREWWHFSFGDQMWAWLYNQSHPETLMTARYGRLI